MYMLQALVEEKTRALAKSDARLEDVRRAAKREAVADRAEIERLTERLYQEHELAIQQLRGAVSVIERAPNNNVIVSDANAGSSSKTAITIPTREVWTNSNKIHEANKELKKKLDASNSARELAESRCSEALCEIQAQRGDLISLASQLKQAEDKQGFVSEDDHFGRSEVWKLQKLVSEKEAKLRSLRESIVKLKAEFVSAEEVEAVSAIVHIQAILPDVGTRHCNSENC